MTHEQPIFHYSAQMAIPNIAICLIRRKRLKALPLPFHFHYSIFHFTRTSFIKSQSPEMQATLLHLFLFLLISPEAFIYVRGKVLYEETFETCEVLSGQLNCSLLWEETLETFVGDRQSNELLFVTTPGNSNGSTVLGVPTGGGSLLGGGNASNAARVNLSTVGFANVRVRIDLVGAFMLDILDDQHGCQVSYGYFCSPGVECFLPIPPEGGVRSGPILHSCNISEQSCNATTVTFQNTRKFALLDNSAHVVIHVSSVNGNGPLDARCFFDNLLVTGEPIRIAGKQVMLGELELTMIVLGLVLVGLGVVFVSDAITRRKYADLDIDYIMQNIYAPEYELEPGKAEWFVLLWDSSAAKG